MALVGELKYIQELHDKGGLTDQEYTDAKAALLKPGTQNVGEEKQPSGSSTTLAVLGGVSALIIVVVLIIAFNQSSRNIQDGSNSSSAYSSSQPIPRPATGNIAHDRLIALSESDQAFYLGMVVMADCRGLGTFYMGMHPDTRAAFWSVRCSNGRNYEVEIDADAGGSTKVLDCSVLNVVTGMNCFEKLR